jgi:hypothetical protein
MSGCRFRETPDNIAVIASEAKQSISPHMRKDGLLRRVAPRNDKRTAPGAFQTLTEIPFKTL